ncbi:extracellular calcium-sensing receptor-like [Ambystoma mexicanum]|uniref:extracellular calcium-sensing receptor-like n=1 Tax=Ambystoma mexicanum TaxID=8296 RepID=UPI0037E7EFF5
MDKVFLVAFVSFHLQHSLSPPFYEKAALFLVMPCLLPASVGQWAGPGCQLHFGEVAGSTLDGDVLVGGVFPVHVYRVYSDTNMAFTASPAPIRCQRFVLQIYQWIQAMMFAIKEVNGNPRLLPNITLGFRIYDSCTLMQRALQGTMWMLTGRDNPLPNYRCQKRPPIAGIVGDSGSSSTIPMARLLGLYRYPQISYFSTSPLLNDKYEFPSFFRTIPSDEFQSRGLGELVMHFGWTWVGLIAEDTDYGQQGIQILRRTIAQAGICVAFSETILTNRADRNAFQIVQAIKGSTAKAIVIVSSGSSLNPVMDEILRQNVTGKIWIASESWSTTALLSTVKYSNILIGTIGFAINSAEMPGFREHLNTIHPSLSRDDIFIREFWEEGFGCKWPDHDSNLGSVGNQTKTCKGDEKLDSVYTDFTNLRITYNVYSAVQAIVLSLQDLRTCTPGQGPFHQGTCANITRFLPWQLLYYVKRVHFQTNEGAEAYFDGSGNPPARYDIVNWQLGPGGTVKHVKVGSYDPTISQQRQLYINASSIHWAHGNKQVPDSLCSPSCLPGTRKVGIEGEPACCFQCAPCPPGEISNRTDTIECSSCPWDQWPNEKQDSCIKKNLEFLSYEESLGTTLAATSICSSVIPVVILALFIHNANTPIIKANNRSLSYVLLLSLSLCFLCSLAFLGYPTPEKCLLRQAAFGITFALCVSCILAKTIVVVIAFNATKPNSDLKKWIGPQMPYLLISSCTLVQVLLCVCWLTVSPPFTAYNTGTNPGKIIVECNEGSPIAFWCMLGYLGVLASISFIVAFLARKLPDSFNEAKFITFSMLAFLSVWISFIPAYLSTQGKYMVAMEIFAILTSSSSLVFCIFFLKCYIILLRPERNSKAFLMGR